MSNKKPLLYIIDVGIHEHEQLGVDAKRVKGLHIEADTWLKAGEIAIVEFQKKYTTKLTPTILKMDLAPFKIIREEDQNE